MIFKFAFTLWLVVSATLFFLLPTEYFIISVLALGFILR